MFNVGDRVKVINAKDPDYFNRVGRIVDFNDDGWYVLVSFDDIDDEEAFDIRDLELIGGEETDLKAYTGETIRLEAE